MGDAGMKEYKDEVGESGKVGEPVHTNEDSLAAGDR